MSLWPAEQSESADYNPDRFKTDDELAAYVIEHHLGGAAAGEPFLLITRFLKNQMHRSGRDPIYHNNLIETVYYGRFGDKLPLISFQKGKKRRGAKPSLLLTSGREDGIRFETMSYVEIVDRRSPSFHEGGLVLSLDLMDQTKIKGTFRPPGNHYFRLLQRGREETSAFSFAVGMKAMERLCLGEAESNREMTAGFIRASALLKLPLISEGIQQERMAFGRAILTELVTKHYELVHAQHQSQEAKNSIVNRLALLREIGFDHDTWEVRVGGLRYHPHELIPDLEALYPKT